MPSSEERQSTPEISDWVSDVSVSGVAQRTLKLAHIFTSTHMGNNSSIEKIGQDTGTYLVAPMPLETFVNLLLPMVQWKRSRRLDKMKFNSELLKMAECTYESRMYLYFINAVQIVCPNFLARDTHRKAFELLNDIEIKPDVCFFSDKSTKQTDIRDVEMMVEFKIIDSDDAFTDSEDQMFEGNINGRSEQSKGTLGQITAYATAHKSSQFRTHLFSLLIFKKHGRILFWDCSGVVVTERFLLTDDYFMEFFLRYNSATQAQRGYDTTVKILSSVEALNAKKLFPKDAKLVKLSVDSQEYVIEHSLFMGTGAPFGRSTRKFVAYPLLKSSVSATPVFLKDTWRLVSRKREDCVYKRLKEEQVPFVATLLGASDMPGQMTKVLEISRDAPCGIHVRGQNLRELQHFRLVLREVASELTTFKSTKELVSVIYDALQAHTAAYEKAGILHGNITVGNIMIGPNRRGLLLDWDLAKNCNVNDETFPEETGIQGTWQFMAVRLLQPIGQGRAQPTPNVKDDWESFVYVLTWVTFRYTPTSFSSEKLGSYMDKFFNGYYELGNGGYAYGGSRVGELETRYALKFLPIGSYLRRLLSFLFDVIYVRYQVDPRTEEPMPEEISPRLLLTMETLESRLERYASRQSFLESSEWIMGLFRHFLGKKKWPLCDSAKENTILMKRP